MAKPFERAWVLQFAVKVIASCTLLFPRIIIANTRCACCFVAYEMPQLICEMIIVARGLVQVRTMALANKWWLSNFCCTTLHRTRFIYNNVIDHAYVSSGSNVDEVVSAWQTQPLRPHDFFDCSSRPFTNFRVSVLAHTLFQQFESVALNNAVCDGRATTTKVTQGAD